MKRRKRRAEKRFTKEPEAEEVQINMKGNANVKADRFCVISEVIAIEIG